VTSRFRVWTDLIEPATIFRANSAPPSTLIWRAHYWLRGAEGTEGISEAPFDASWFVSCPA
jgi:hypothetical protein